MLKEILDGLMATDENNTVVVVFVGGCTRAEIATLKALGRHLNRKFFIVTTGQVTGLSIINAARVRWANEAEAPGPGNVGLAGA